MANVAFELMAKLGLNSSEFESGMSKASGTVNGFTGVLGKIGKAATAAFAAATTAVVAFGAKSVSAGAEFDKSMSQVVATMGYTVEQLNATDEALANMSESERNAALEAQANFKALRDFAQEEGRTTVFSATQAADALNYMALAGYDAETSMKMLPNVLNLAASGNIDLAYASDMVTDAQTALGLSLDDTEALVDQMAKTASKSNTSVSQLGEAILTIGGTAQFMAGGTDRLNTVLGILADNGIKGSEAGTHLRNMLLKLSSPTKEGADTIAALGLEVFDAQGNMRDMQDIIQDLGKAMENFTDEEKVQAISNMFNARDVVAVQALLKTSADRWDELGDAIVDSTGAAEAMANVQLDNLTGDITLFKSAMEGLHIAVSDSITPTLRTFVQFGSSAISSLTEGFKEGGIDGAMEVFGTILSDGIAMITEMLPSIVEAGSKVLVSFIDGVITNIPTVIEASTSIIDTIVTTTVELLPKILEAGIQILTKLVEGVIQAMPKLIEQAPILIQNLTKALTDNLPQLITAGLKMIPMIILGIIRTIPELIKSAPMIIKAVYEGIGGALEPLLRAGKEMVDKVWEGFKEKVSNAWQWGADLIASFKKGIEDKWNALKQGVKNIGQGIKNFLGFSEPKEGPLSDFHTYAPDMMELFAKGIRDNEDVVYDQLKKSFDLDDYMKIGSVSVGGTPQGQIQNQAKDEEPLKIVVPVSLNGRIVGEAVYEYLRGRTRAGEFAL